MKRCNVCLNEFPLDCFYRDRKSKDQHQRLCKTCQLAAVKRTVDPVRARAYARKYYAEHPGYVRAWEQRNPAKVLATRERNKARDAITARKRYLKNRDAILVERRAYRLAHRDAINIKAKLYYVQHRDAIIAKQAAWRRRKANGE